MGSLTVFVDALKRAVSEFDDTLKTIERGAIESGAVRAPAQAPAPTQKSAAKRC